MGLHFASEVGRLARSRRGYGGWAVNLRVSCVAKVCKTQREIIAHYIMLTFPEKVFVPIGNYIIRKIPLNTIEGHKIVKTSQWKYLNIVEAIVENVSSLVHIRNTIVLNRNLCILELEFLNPINYTLYHFLEIPSIPRNTKVTFKNQSTVKLTWQLPEVTGYHTDVYYDVECRNTCNDEVNCGETACRGQVSYLPSKQGLHETHVLITHLSSFVTYEFRIYARNRVSGVAQKMHGIVGNYALYRVTTNASSESVCFFFYFSVNGCTK